MNLVKAFFSIIALLIKAFLRWFGSFDSIIVILMLVTVYKFHIGSLSGYLYLTLGILCVCTSQICKAIRDAGKQKGSL